MNQVNPSKNLIPQRAKPPVELLKSGRLMNLANNQSSGLIIKKPYYAEFVGPGSAVGGMFDIQCTTLYALGNAEFEVPSTQIERQQAFQNRITDIETLQEFCQQDSPLQRAVSLLQFLAERFPLEEIQMISNDVLAQLVGVLPSTIVAAWQAQSQPQLESLRAHQPVTAG